MFRGLVLATIVFVAASNALAQHGVLEGTVVSGGKPLADATVLVSRAWPREGLAHYCPSCYLDCTKSALADGKGTWRIEALDDSLVFELLVVARGHAPAFVKRVDPAKGRPVDVTLDARDLSKFTPDQIVRGRVVGPDGKPVAQAQVCPEMVHFPEFNGGRGGLVDGLDLVAVTDADGEFVLTYAAPCAAMDLAVEARGLARMCEGRVRSGENRTTIKMAEGATIEGRVEFGGRPLANVGIVLASANRTMGACFQHVEISTDADGKFAFVNVRAPSEYVLCATWESMSKFGSVPITRVKVEADGQTVRVPNFAVTRGRHVVGRVILPKGKELPVGARLAISNEIAWDYASQVLGPGGTFEFVNMPDGMYSLNLTAPGLWISPKNASFERLNKRMVGTLDRDIPELLVELTDQDTAKLPDLLTQQVPALELGGDEPTPPKKPKP